MIKGFRRIACAALVVLSLASLLLFTVSAAGDGGYDYSRPASMYNETIGSAEVLELYLGEEVSESERAYLIDRGTFSLTYESGISTGYISTEYSEDERELYITAYKYIYTDAVGREVVWTPYAATVGEETKELLHDTSADSYYTEFSAVDEDDGLFANIEYRLTLTLAKDDINALINKVYNDAPALEQEIADARAEYEEKKAKYDSDKLAYDKYVIDSSAYEIAYAEYEIYSAAKAAYDIKKAARDEYDRLYDEYEAALLAQEAFDALCEKYDADYAAWVVYDQAMQEYIAQKSEYDRYPALLAAARAQLGIIEATKTRTSFGVAENRSVFNALNGNLVDRVLNEFEDDAIREELGVSEEIVAMARVATVNLRSMLDAYFEINDEQDKYIYYINNYDSLKKEFINLLQALDIMYTDRLAGAVHLQDSTYVPKFIVLVAQLARIANALNGTPVQTLDGKYFDSKYTINDANYNSYTIDRLVPASDFVPTVDTPVPLEDGYPVQGDEPVEPEYVAHPGDRPTGRPVAILPEYVEDPGDPPTPIVEHPGDPPEYVEDPGDPPEEYVPADYLVNIITDYKAGTLREREAALSDAEITLSHTVNKKLFNVTSYSVTFCDRDTGELLCPPGTVEEGSVAEYSGSLPQRAEDASGSYVFAGWEDEEGNVIALDSISEDITLYPHFTKIDKYYDIIFTVDGTEYTQSVKYGDMPVFDDVPHKPYTTYYKYKFAGWDMELVPVTADAVYTAVFEEEFIFPIGDTGAPVSFSDGYAVADCTDFGTSLELGSVASFVLDSGAPGGLKVQMKLGTLTLSPDTLAKMLEDGNTALDVKLTKGVEYTYQLIMSSPAAGAGTHSAEQSAYTIDVSFECNMPYDSIYTHMYRVVGEDRTLVAFRYADNTVSFRMLTGYKYLLRTEYSLTVLPSSIPDVGVTTQYGAYMPGETVELSLSLPEGVRLDSVKLMYAGGVEKQVAPVDGRYTFTMPGYDVSVGLNCSYIQYTVKFMDGNSVLVSYTHRYGDTVTPPKDPQKEGYLFIGWDCEIEPVTRDVIYRAQFSEVDTEAPIAPPVNTNSLARRLLAALHICINMFWAVVVPSAVLGITAVVYERRKYSRPKKGRKEK